jgi:hypothetical protein
MEDKKCDCTIGRLCYDDITKSTIEFEVKSTIEKQVSLDKFGLLKGKPATKKEILDGRKGYISRFNFCPYCGTKVNWKQIISDCLAD